MDFDIDLNFSIFDSFLEKRPEVSEESLKNDLIKYYLPYIKKLINLKAQKSPNHSLIIGVSAIQGAGKTTQGEILEVLLDFLGHETISLSIDDHYITHEQLNVLRQKDPRFIRRGLTHDIPLAILELTQLQNMNPGDKVKIAVYDKGLFNGDGDRLPESQWRIVDKKPDFIFYDGWMLGARSVIDESIFESGLPALDTPEHIQFAKDCNKKLSEYEPLWQLIDFMNVLYVPNYQMSLNWRDQAEDHLRQKGEGMTHQEVVEFVHYFWQSVHPAIQIKNLAQDTYYTDQVVVIQDDHSVGSILQPKEFVRV